MIAKQILHYRILEKLGEGGMGVVYLAEDTKLERKVAIKFLPRHIAGNSDERKRFEIEAKAAAALNHPNIATIHAIEEVDDEMFIVMEYIEGQELKNIIHLGAGATGPVAPEVGQCIQYAIQIAKGLQAAHEKSIIHRDIKSSNIMVTKSGQVKIMDFGLAKVRGGIELTKEQSTIGTAAYMSPEQARGDKVDQRSDLWSFFVVVYEMLTGQLPFRGDYDQAVIYAILNEDPQPPHTLNAMIPRSLSDLVLQTLVKDPNNRMSSATEILQRFEAFTPTRTADTSSLLQLLKKPQVLVVLMLALFIPTIFYIFSIYGWQSQNSQIEQTLEIKQATEASKYVQAFELSRQAGNTLQGDSTFQRLQPIISNNLTILSNPDGAAVYLKPFNQDPEGQDQTEKYVGSTPIHDLLLARDDYLLRIEKEDHLSVIRLASSELNRLRSNTGSKSNVLVSVKLSPVGGIPQDMVPISSGRYKLVGAGAPTTQTVNLDSFLIDKFEVSNLQFKEFILNGGYNNKSYWKYSFVKNGKNLSRKVAMDIFRDRSGLPGPRNWVNQEFPAGEEHHPVTNISWYEAVAYAEFAGKSLPTVFEWEKAARDGASTGFGAVMPWGPIRTGQSIIRRTNLNGQGTMPVNSFEFGISPYGCFNMSGNVKEWCFNRITGGYVATGGSWQDPIYVFAQYGALDGFYSSPTLGFRCVKRSADLVGDQGAFRIDVNEGTPEYQPVDEKTFTGFLSHYKYDKKPIETKVIEIKETDDWIREKRTFMGPRVEDVIIYLYLPRRVAKPYQCLFYVPGVGVFMGRSLPEGLEFTVGSQIKSGRAVCSVVLKGATEREWGSGHTRPATSSVQFREEMVLHATEIRMGIDYLETRDDLDMKKFAYFGRSWGAGSRLGFAAIDNRFNAVIFLGGGIDERVKPTLPEADNINFAPYIKPPKLMVNGKYDEEHNWLTRGLPLYNLLHEPKELALLEGGHMPSVELRTPVINAWVDKVLGPVTFK